MKIDSNLIDNVIWDYGDVDDVYSRRKMTCAFEIIKTFYVWKAVFSSFFYFAYGECNMLDFSFYSKAQKYHVSAIFLFPIPQHPFSTQPSSSDKHERDRNAQSSLWQIHTSSNLFNLRHESNLWIRRKVDIKDNKMISRWQT